MSRWHHPSCDTPSVFVQAGLPYCKSCGESPDINELVTEQANVKPPWTIPRDEKPGELRLRWPASVIRNPPDEVSTETPTTMNEQTKVSSSIHIPASLTHHIYTRRLDDTEFRILSISPTVNEDCPIHAVLGDYQIDSCPEYETVSYCWGGEDGDARQNRPVYIGDYWDVLLQTKNCWSMLQYIRLESHTRLIWVDAICINQNDHLEKETQVPLMGRIYWRCLRTIIYLGDDVAKPKGLFPTKGRLHPKRHDFTEFEDLIPNTLMSVEQLLELRYFQRVWVIQEVILAPSAVIPAHGYLFRLRAETRHIPSWEERGGDPSLPWVVYACTGSVAESLTSLLQRTRSSLATDPRDKVYGILGLGLEVEGVRPDYSISRLHTYVGTILHLFCVEQCVMILTQAGDNQSGVKFPSWLPNWSLEDMGERLLSVCAATRRISNLERIGIDQLRFGERIANADNDYTPLFIALDDTTWRSGFIMSKLWTVERPSVDPATLKLTMPLIHVCKFSSALVKVGSFEHFSFRRDKTCNVFSIEAAGHNIYVFIPDITNQIPVEAGDNELFLLKESRQASLVFFMRRLSVNGEYTLLWCARCCDLLLSRNLSSKPPLDLGESIYRHSFSKTGFSILVDTVTDVKNDIAERRGRDSANSQASTEMVTPCDQKNVNDCVLNLAKQTVHDSQTSFVDTYVAFLSAHCPSCVAWNEEGKAYVEISPKELMESCTYLSFSPYNLELEVFVPFNSEIEGSGTWKAVELEIGSLKKATGYEDDLMGKIMTIRVSAEKLRGCLRWSRYDETVAFMEWNCNRILQNAESILSSAGPWNTTDAFCYYAWPESFFKEGQIPGRICQVTIV